MKCNILCGTAANCEEEEKWCTAPTVDDDTASKFAKLANASSKQTVYSFQSYKYISNFTLADNQ